MPVRRGKEESAARSHGTTVITQKEKHETKITVLAAPLVVLSALSFAQVSWSNNYFSTTFVGPVTFTQNRNDANTSSGYIYDASNNNVAQTVVVRLVDHDIPYGTASTDFYEQEDLRRNPSETPTNFAHGTYQGHPFTYVVFYLYTQRCADHGAQPIHLHRSARSVLHNPDQLGVLRRQCGVGNLCKPDEHCTIINTKKKMTPYLRESSSEDSLGYGVIFLF